MERFIQIAGLLQLGIASANFFAVRMFRYHEAMAPVPEAVRQVFWIQNIFIVVTVIGISLLCLVHPTELAAGIGMGSAISGFLAFFWGLRLGVQLFYYSRAKRSQYPVFDLLFVMTFLYLTVVFAISAFGYRAG